VVGKFPTKKKIEKEMKKEGRGKKEDEFKDGESDDKDVVGSSIRDKCEVWTRYFRSKKGDRIRCGSASNKGKRERKKNHATILR